MRVTVATLQDLVRPAMTRLHSAVVREILGSPKSLYPFLETTGTTFASLTLNTNPMSPYKGTVALTDIAQMASGGPTASLYAYVLPLDGIDENLRGTDADDFSFGNGTIDAAFSVGATIYLEERENREIFAKWDESTAAEKREWRFALDASGHLELELCDESEDATLKATALTPLAEDEWHFVVATYDGSSTVSGIRLYVAGSSVSDSDSTTGTYVAMENLSTIPTIGCALTTAAAGTRYFQGSIGLPFLANKELSPNEVYDLYLIYKGMFEEL